MMARSDAIDYNADDPVKTKMHEADSALSADDGKLDIENVVEAYD